MCAGPVLFVSRSGRAGDQRREFRQRGATDERVRRHPGHRLYVRDQCRLRRRAGEEHLPARFDHEAARDRREPLGGVAAGGCRRARMNDDPRPGRIDRRLRQQAIGASGRLVGHAQPHPLIGRAAADRGDQIELAPHFVANAPLRLRLRHPVGEQLIGILPAVRQPERDVREVAEEGGRQRILAENGEDHRRVELPRPQPLRHREFRAAVRARGGRLHPRRIVDDHVVNHRDQRRDGRPGRRGEQRQAALRLALFERRHRGRGHQHVPDMIEAHAEHIRRVSQPCPCRRHMSSWE